MAKVSGPVRITVPASVAFNIEKMQKLVQSIGERLGCTGCISGADCVLQLERDWMVDPQTLALRQGLGF
jgi:hypothetical protein